MKFLCYYEQDYTDKQWSSDETEVEAIFGWSNRPTSYTQGINILKNPIEFSSGGKKNCIISYGHARIV